MHIAKAIVSARPSGDKTWVCDAFGSRALMPIANRPVLLHLLEGLRAAGLEAVLIVVEATTADDVRAAVDEDADRYGLAVEYMEAPAGSGLVDVVRRARPFLADEPFLVQDGDAFIGEEIDVLGERLVAEDLDALVLRLAAHPRVSSPTPAPTTLPAVVGYLVGHRGLSSVDAARLELPELLARNGRHRGRVRVQEVNGSLPCRGGPELLLDANRRALEQLCDEPVSMELDDSELQGRVVVDSTARLERALVRGPAIIGPRTQVVDAYVGPYTSLGADVVVEGCEVEHSIVLNGASIRFLGARLETSIVGSHAHIGRDFGFPHALRLLVGERSRVTLG